MFGISQHSMMRRNSVKWGGFTLVEVMIVVLILAIVGMIVVPQFGFTLDKSRNSMLMSDVAMIRRQIIFYNIEHPGFAPHLDKKGKLNTNKFIDRLTERTDVEGTLSASGQFGPYVPAWPENPFGDHDVSQLVAFGTETCPPRDGSTGWYYCTRTGIFSANSTEGGELLDPVDDGYVE